jgi:4-hydroxy-tetrahydrodipicolinate reductase
MIKVIVNGANGRMGKEAVNAIKNDAELELVAGCDYQDDLATIIKETGAQVVIDLTAASAGYKNTQTILNAGACPVIGTSGFQVDQVKELQALASNKQLGGLIAPNFSIGAVLMMQFATQAAKYFPNAEVIESHSPQKEESPSGTAIRTAELIATARVKSPIKCSDKELIEGARGAELHNVKIHSLRLPGIVAQQTVFFGGVSETLKIEHNSQHRESFMPGICLACKEVIKRNELLYGLEHLME